LVSIAAAWCLINAGLYLEFIGLAEQAGLSIPARLTLVSVLLWIPLTEVSLFGLAMSGLKTMRRAGRPSAKVLARLLIPIAITVTAVLLLVVITSWLTRADGQSFPKLSVVRAFLTNLGSIAPAMTFKEVVYLAWALVVGGVVAAGIFRLTPELSSAELKRFPRSVDLGRPAATWNTRAQSDRGFAEGRFLAHLHASLGGVAIA
jgi:hypothetical protein